MDSKIRIQINISQNIDHKPSISKKRNKNLQPPKTRIKTINLQEQEHFQPLRIKAKTFNL
jgi:hypothetical protein